MAVRTETSILLIEEAARVRAAQMTQTAEQVQWESEDLADQAVRMRREAGLNGPVTTGPPRPAEERPTLAWPPVKADAGALPPAVIDHMATAPMADTTVPDTPEEANTDG